MSQQIALCKHSNHPIIPNPVFMRHISLIDSVVSPWGYTYKSNACSGTWMGKRGTPDGARAMITLVCTSISAGGYSRVEEYVIGVRETLVRPTPRLARLPFGEPFRTTGKQQVDWLRCYEPIRMSVRFGANGEVPLRYEPTMVTLDATSPTPEMITEFFSKVMLGRHGALPPSGGNAEMARQVALL